MIVRIRRERGPGRLRRLVRDEVGLLLVVVLLRSVAEDQGEDCFVVGVSWLLFGRGRGVRRPISASVLSSELSLNVGCACSRSASSLGGSGTKFSVVVRSGVASARSSTEGCFSY